MKKVLILTVMATLLFATTALAFDEAIEARCFEISPYCNQISINWQAGGQIWGKGERCDGVFDWLVGGWFYSKTDWVMFLDWLGSDFGEYEYAILKGSGKNAQMWRYSSDGTMAGPTAVQLIDCTQAEGGGGQIQSVE